MPFNSILLHTVRGPYVVNTMNTCTNASALEDDKRLQDNIVFLLYHRTYREQETFNEEYDSYRFHTNIQNEEISKHFRILSALINN